MVSDSDLASRIRELLLTVDFFTTTNNTVFRQLEDYYAVDLSDRKAFIREQIDVFLRSSIFKIEAKAKTIQKEKKEEVEGGEKVDEDAENVEENGKRYEKKGIIEKEKESDGKAETEGRSNKVVIDVEKRDGYNKLWSLSPQLQKIVEAAELTMRQVVKKFWTYIRENSVQDPKNIRNIICDESLCELLHVDSINTFEIYKVLSKHVGQLNVIDAPANLEQNGKNQHKQGREEGLNEPKENVEEQQKFTLFPLLPLSDALVKFLGASERALTLPNVKRKIWEYIRQNNLQDPWDKQIILCDSKLEKLLEVDSFLGSTLVKFLAPHLVKREC